MASSTPYADAVCRLAAADLQRLNVPGHAADPGAAPLLADFFGKQVLRRDFEPLLDGLDKGDPNPLREAQAAAQQAWGARRTWFLTNGASQANRMGALAMAMYDAPEAPVVVQRSAHSSFIDGIILGGIAPKFVQPSVDSRFGINHGVTASALADALAGSDAKAAYIVSPSYFGAVADVASMAQACHALGIPLMVDAAWGAHFGFHPQLPANPLALGADLVVSSTHKMGGSLTQSAMLHLGDGPFADELEPLIDRAFMLTQSTSASSLLLASLDLARATLQDGAERIGRSIKVAEDLREAVRHSGRFGIVSDSFGRFPDIVATDPMRVSIDVRRGGLNGHLARERLMAQSGTYTEIATDSCIVAFLGPGTTPDVDRFMTGLSALPPRPDLVAAQPGPGLPAPGAAVMLPRQAVFGRSELVPAASAAGRVSADSLAAYPPGVPNALPGELLTAETIDFLRQIATMPGGYVRGAADPAVTQVRVVA